MDRATTNGVGRDVAASAISTPAPSVTCAPVRARWARHEGDRFFHGIEIVEAGQSAVTFCFGRWPAQDLVENSDAPPHEDRCDACSRRMIEVKRIERGLDELAAFDLGGEGG